MSKRIGRMISLRVALLLGLSGLVFAHDPQTPKSSMDSMCQGHHAAAMKASDQVKAHLAEAKRSGTMADMRKHVELADKAMADMEKHMSLCMEQMEKMHGGMPPGEKAASAVDPVCNMAVDTASAPSAMNEGTTYYFCSEQDKAKFEKNPAQYLKKG